MWSSVRIIQFTTAPAFVPLVIYVGSKNMISATRPVSSIETSLSGTFMASFEQFEGTSLNHDQ